jgi:hypothetical protein
MEKDIGEDAKRTSPRIGSFVLDAEDRLPELSLLRILDILLETFQLFTGFLYQEARASLTVL